MDSTVQGKAVTISEETNIYQILNWVKKIAQESADTEEIKKIAAGLKNCPDPIKAVFNYAYNAAVYQADPIDSQDLKRSAATIRDKKGNCADYAILISSLLQNIGIKHYFRVTGYESPRVYEHIYVITDKGVVLDPVLGQKQDGSDTFENRPKKGKFSEERTYLTKKDFPVKLRVLSGVNGGVVNCSCNNLQAGPEEVVGAAIVALATLIVKWVINKVKEASGFSISPEQAARLVQSGSLKIAFPSVARSLDRNFSKSALRINFTPIIEKIKKILGTSGIDTANSVKILNGAWDFLDPTYSGCLATNFTLDSKRACMCKHGFNDYDYGDGICADGVFTPWQNKPQPQPDPNTGSGTGNEAGAGKQNYLPYVAGAAVLATGIYFLTSKKSK
jgi:hypothetical protein